MRVDFSARARKELARAIRWWMDEGPGGRPPILDAVQLGAIRIVERPGVGTQYTTMRGRPVMRVLLASVQRYLYYRVDPDRIVVLSLWSTARPRGPRFGPP